MRLVADESCDFSVVVAVRAAGHDVVSIMEAMPGVDDERVIAVATGDKRLLLTDDKDFGQLVFAAAKENSGVILIRYPASARSTLPARSDGRTSFPLIQGELRIQWITSQVSQSSASSTSSMKGGEASGAVRLAALVLLLRRS